MERQKSLSFKPTRLLVFSFIISSSLIFLSVFTLWVLNSTPLILKETSFEFNETSPVFGLTAKTLYLSDDMSRNFSSFALRSSIPRSTLFRGPKNTSGSSSFPVVGREERERDTVNDSLTTEQGSVLESSSVDIQVKEIEKPDGDFVLRDEIEVSSNESDVEVKTGPASIKKIEDLSEEGELEEERSRGTSIVNRDKIKEDTVASDCDLTTGRWVYDESYPLYTNNSCRIIDEGFDCLGNGRLDRSYMKWRWVPQHCGTDRFNATKMLEFIRGKRLVFVGDSINRNQWESTLCMLMTAVKDPKRVYETHGRRITKEKGNYSFRFADYQCTVEYYASHFLVHESKARIRQKRVQTLRIDAIDHGSSRWRGADILVFNTAHWWSHYKTKAGINYYQEGNTVHPQLDVSMAFRRALTTWSSWVDRHINPRKTRVFFRSSAPSHFRGGQWNSGGHCTEATQPLESSITDYTEKNMIAQEIINNMKTPVTFLNISILSGYRIDGHPSIYGRKQWKSSRSSVQDCSHWCLPGVPDTWNELLYFHLLSKQRIGFQ